ncbi:MAG: hypothetical protein ABI640_09665 [Gammaproteobacteria bacterium]
MKRSAPLFACLLLTGAALGQTPGSARQAPTARSSAPVDLTGYWVSVVTEDWAWRMRTPPKGDYASIPLNAAGEHAADTWTEAEDGSCLAFGAPAMLRMPTRARITWVDDQTLKLETDNGVQTRLLHFGPSPANSSGAPSLQGGSHATWQIPNQVTDRGENTGQKSDDAWAPLKVVTTNLSPAWLRPNGVPYSANAVLTEYFDRFADGDDAWFVVTTIVDDPAYLTEPLVISSNFKREANGAKWAPKPCKG